MSYLNEYKQRKEAICSLLGRASNVFKDINEQDSKSIEELQKITAEGKFSVVVAGQFSSGKSTFLNALMGEKYLPSFTKETTATINELKSVEESPIGKPAIKVNYRDGHSIVSEDVSLANISKYVCTDGDDVINKVASVELFLDSPFLNDGVRLIDTPGLNGIAEGHKEVTYGKLGETHASIFMFCATAPGSKTDYDLLKDIKDSGSSVIFVLNQIDLINESEGETPESVIENLRKGYATKFDDTLPEIWPVSSYEALVGRNSTPLKHNDRFYETPEDKKMLVLRSRIEDFEDRLIKYLTTGERTKAELLSPVKQLEAKIIKSSESLSQSLSLLNSDVSVSDLKEKKDDIEKEISIVKEKNNGNIRSVRNKVSQLIYDTEDGIKSDSRDIRSKFLSQVEKSEGELDEFEANSRSFLRRMENQYKEAMESRLETLNKEVKKLISESFEEYSMIVNDHINGKMNRISFDVKGASLDSSYFDIDLDIDAYENQLDDLYNKQFDTSMAAADEAHLATVAEKNLNNLEVAKSEISDIRKSGKDRIDSLGLRPGAEERSRNVTKKVSGLKGFGKWIMSGSRDKNVIEYYMDYSRQEAYDRKLNDIRYEMDSELDAAQHRYEELKRKDTDVDGHRNNERKYNAELQMLERQIERCKARREQNIHKELRKRTRAAKEYVESLLEDIDKNHRDAAIKELRDQENNISELITKVINDVLSIACEEKQKELSLIIEKLESGAEKIENERNEITSKLEALKELRVETVDLRREIEDIETDEIEQK